MPNWKRTPQVSGMSVEEMKKRVADGIANRRKSGLMPSLVSKTLKTLPSGPVLNKKQRRVLIRSAELAIYSLANDERQDYIAAVAAIDAVRRQVGMSTQFMREFLEGIASQAAELRGDNFKLVDMLARAWLAAHYQPSGKLISIPKGIHHGNTEKDPHCKTTTAPSDGQ